MAVALGVLVALAWGSADFLGGFTSQRVHTVTVLLVSQTFGLAAAIVLVLALRDSPPDPHVFVLSAIAGVVGVAALALLFHGLAVGRMSVVAPLSAVGGGVLPLAWGLLRGEEPTMLALVGVALALIAVVIVGRGAEHDPVPSIPPTRELTLGVTSGVGFGVVLILFSESATNSGMWPVLIARCAAVPVLAVVALALGRFVRVARPDVAPIAGSGLFDVCANAIVLLAVRRGLLSLVAPVAALYPAMTVMLARVVLHERIGRQRVVGLALGLAGLALIATR
jgi:uncharacterized membrane protein